MKTINQDDHTMYHLFFSDNESYLSQRIDLGHHSIQKKLIRYLFVAHYLRKTSDTLDFWAERLEQAGICHYGVETFNQHPILRFEAPDNTQINRICPKGLILAIIQFKKS
jgi:glyoxalase family protein